MKYDNSGLTLVTDEVEAGAIRWRSPSNIALVKYWGKHGDQLPRNASVSFTLDAAATDTTLHYTPRQQLGEGIDLELYLDGNPRVDFAERTRTFFSKLLPIYPFLRQLSFRVETQNSFPHSAGIASSASGMSALALCLVSLEEALFEPLTDRGAFYRKASFLARLGSGSASRSVYGSAAVWGKSEAVADSSDEYAVSIADRLHPVFQTYHDDILLVSREEKSVSSRAGHGLMEQNPYAPPRYDQANRRVTEMLRLLMEGDTENFGQLLESEALTLHALMMSSRPYYTLIEPNTLHVIKLLQHYRRETGHPVHFTLDAGPNVHLLYPDAIAGEVKDFIRGHLLPYCEDKLYLADRVGKGPQQLAANTTTSVR
ncbi:diphosphomevalonate decarboxylase [Neolewinella xylanilytica]|uniref:Diphosphomevalonate decarboxylase n=1 Tax=Neolewinella xylanilytica TaxID=1514080 RepID=A0A2S6I6P2_9BACT|nr:diphosphomevalonate decarboxylase [Neolewinella xylanilytica]PPK87183.1 diphosphomevalonate decarboxylase [Neolewinella xylanilytica]